MKYSVDIKNGVAKETLVFNGKEYVRTAKRVGSGSSFIGMDFSEQMENDGLSDNVLDKIYDILDGFFVGDLLDIAESEENACKDCHYDDGEPHAECVVCDKVESEEE